MIGDLIIVASCAATIYGWLCAVIPPLGRAVRTCVAHASWATGSALALAMGGAILWTFIPLAAVFILMTIDPRVGLALVRNAAWLPGVVAGAACWLCHAAAARRIPRIGSDFEVATALALVALVRDDPATLSRVERLYRASAAQDGPLASAHWALAAGN